MFKKIVFIVNSMSTVGIMRFGTENDYLFVAETDSAGVFHNVTVYHDSDTFGLSKSVYKISRLLSEDRILWADHDTVFYGDDLIRLYEISPAAYAGIFDHSDDAAWVFGRARARIEHDYRDLPLLELNQLWESTIPKLVKNIPSSQDVEYAKAIDAAREAGFNEFLVNGRPRAVGTIVSTEELFT